MSDESLLDALRDAMEELTRAERERSRAWAFAGSGLLGAPESRAAQMEAERELEEAHERVRRARAAVLVHALEDDRAWGGH